MKAIIGIDPSGNFYEGKGTTGICCLIQKNKGSTVLECVSVCAKQHTSQGAYWKAVLDQLDLYKKKYKKNLYISMEDYLIYARTAMSQVNSHCETSQIIGVIKMWCYANNTPLYMRNANTAKQRWSDDILLKIGVLHSQGNNFMFDGRALCDHERDALRHALHCATFDIERGTGLWHVVQ